MKRAALYARASVGGPNTEDQLRELNGAASRCGWQIVGEFVEQGTAGGRSKGERLALDRLIAAAGRREIELVAACSLDRLGRSVPDLLGLLCELRSHEVDLYLHHSGVDTCTPTGRALYQLLDVFDECERTLAVEGTLAGLSETWTIRGVSAETREAVREAAAAQKMPLGAWIDRALWQAAQAALQPIPAPATQDDIERIVQRLLAERLDPLARKLERLEQA